MSKTIVFVHGAWMTPLCWEEMLGFFRGKGYTCLAPTWPHKDMPIEELREHPPQALAGLGVTEIVDHYERIIRGLDEPPILIGHSFGGLFVQMLLDRGVGAAGVALDPRQATRVNFGNATRAPLLIIAGTEDRVVPASVVRANFKKYRGSKARTDFKAFAGRTHWLIAQQGWEEVAEYIAVWLKMLQPQEVKEPRW